MKITLAALGLLLSFSAFADGLIVNSTRFIYPEKEKEITVQITNGSDRPSLAQVWLDNGDPDVSPDKISTPFIINPPISRVDARSGQVIRIKLSSDSGLPKNKESIWWLNLLDIPGSPKNEVIPEGSSEFKMAIRSRLKLIYRPDGLGSRESALKQLTLRTQGSALSISNPTPFYITVAKISRGSSDALNNEVFMIAPLSSQVINLRNVVKSGEELTLEEINDYGSRNISKVKTS